MQERRKEQRWPAFMGGRIVHTHGDWATSCIVRNLSPSGARIDLTRAMLVPEEFSLRIPWQKIELRMRTRWRNDHQVGVETVAEVSACPTDLEIARRMRDVDLSNQELKRRLSDMNEA
jgi:hypothetical protein